MGNASYERFGKLMAQLGKIVFDDKRHLETVCTSLQMHIFNKTQWPKSKDWNEIRYVAKRDRLMAEVLANLDLDKRDGHTEQVIAAFAYCFREEEVMGPIPLSCIRAMAIRNGKKDMAPTSTKWEREHVDENYLALLPESFDVLNELNLPYKTFATSNKADRWNEIEWLPSFISPYAEQGDPVWFDAEKYVVVENNQNPGVNELTIVSTEYVDPTC